MNLPPFGTKCADCAICDAAIYANDEPICCTAMRASRAPARRSAIRRFKRSQL